MKKFEMKTFYKKYKKIDPFIIDYIFNCGFCMGMANLNDALINCFRTLGKKDSMKYKEDLTEFYNIKDICPVQINFTMDNYFDLLEKFPEVSKKAMDDIYFGGKQLHESNVVKIAQDLLNMAGEEDNNVYYDFLCRMNLLEFSSGPWTK